MANSEDDMTPRSATFVTALLSGMAAPVSLFSTPPSYGSYVTVIGPRQGLTMAGVYLTGAMGKLEHDQRGR